MDLAGNLHTIKPQWNGINDRIWYDGEVNFLFALLSVWCTGSVAVVTLHNKWLLVWPGYGWPAELINTFHFLRQLVKV